MIDDQRIYMRDPDVVAVGTAGHYLFVDASGKASGIDVADAEACSTLLRDLVEPAQGSRLRDEPLAERLLEAKVLLESRDAATLLERRERVFTANAGYHFRRSEPRCEHLVVALTGSVVSGLMAPAILSLAYSGYARQLDLILTETALRFATRDLFEAYGVRTWVDPFERRDGIRVAHVGLGGSAACVLVMPASAASLQRLADAACTDLLSMVVAATQAPVIAVPAMNGVMWSNAAVRRNARRLRDDGVYVVDPTLIVAAAALAEGAAAMVGGPGTLWRGPLGLMQTLDAVMTHHKHRSARA